MHDRSVEISQTIVHKKKHSKLIQYKPIILKYNMEILIIKQCIILIISHYRTGVCKSV